MALCCRFLIVLTLLAVCSGLGFAQDTTTVPPDSAGLGPVVEPTSFSPTSFGNVHVSQDPTGRFQGEPTIAINPRNPENLAAAWIDYRLDNRPAVATSYFLLTVDYLGYRQLSSRTTLEVFLCKAILSCLPIMMVTFILC